MLCKLMLGLSCLLGAGALFAEEAPAEVQVDMPQLSKELGWLIGKNLAQPAFQFDTEKVIEGIRAGIAGEEAPMSEVEYARQLAVLQERAFKEQAAANLKAADTFLAENKKKDGVKTLDEAGKLQIQDLEKGSGEAVADGATVMIEYVGKFIDGNTFSASSPNEPIRLNLGEVVPGFRQGLLGMQKGGRRVLFIHPDLGYGASSALGPNQLLIFEVTMVDPSAPAEQAEPGEQGAGEQQ
jgi:peptidylprolyl isomerase